MQDALDINDRLQRSVRTLREWRWMARISTDPQAVVGLLHAEARELIELGRQHPERAADIGKLIFAYHKLILSLREGSPQAAVA